MPAYEAATIFGAIGGKHATGVRAAREVYIALWVSKIAAVGTIAADTTVDDSADVTVRDGRRAVGTGNKSRTELLCSIDSTRHLQVLDSGTIRITEWSAVLLVEGTPGRAFCEGQRMNAVTEEGALEHMAACTHHLRNTDVGYQLHVLAAVVFRTVVHV